MALTVSNVKYDAVNGVCTFKGVNDGSSAAASVYLGFAPRYITCMNVTDGIRDEYFPDVTAGSSLHTAANGTVTVAANGFTALTGNEASPATTATGSPVSGGPGFSAGTGILLASKTFNFTCWR